MKIKAYIKLIRIHHWLKNALVFLALIFSRNLFEADLFFKTLIGFFSFSLISSGVYIINDIFDAKKDRLHNIKKLRPIASGAISIKNAAMLAIVFIIAAMLLNALAANLQISPWIFISVYLIANISYSFKLKNIPLIDVIILSSGFILRVLYGGAITQISVSNWLLLVLMSFSFFMGFGKRRNEIKTKNESARTVLKHYKYNFLNSNLYVCLALTVMFYAMWSIDMSLNFDGKDNLVWTTFAVLFISLRYSMNIENQESADPIDVLFGDKILMLLIAAYALMMFFILYGGNLL